MPVEDLDIIEGSTRIRTKGLAKAIRALERAGADAQDMRELMHDLGMIVVRAVILPIRSGLLDSTLRAGRGKTKAVVRSGGARAPYAPIVEYGDPHRGIAGQSQIRDAFAARRGELYTELDNGIEEILRKNDLV